MKYAIGIDVGGTKIAAGVVDSQGNLLTRFYSRAHTGHPPALVLDGIAEAFHAVLAQSGIPRTAIDGVGIGCAGHIHHANGIVIACSNLPNWNNVPLRDMVADCLGMTVRLDNDATCAALGEYLFGAGQGSRDMCYVAFSTGFGAGFVLDGHLYRGAIGTAGEIGHTIIVPDGELCTCGKRGCFMAYASGLALSRMACQRVCAGESTCLRDICGESPEYISGETIAKAASQGDALALDLVQTAARYFGISLANLVELLNPEVIVIGGGLARIGSTLLDPCIRAMRENLQPVFADVVRIVPSTLWDEAGLIGAAALVWENECNPAA
jgi:glucokinase